MPNPPASLFRRWIDSREEATGDEIDRPLAITGHWTAQATRQLTIESDDPRIGHATNTIMDCDDHILRIHRSYG